MIGLDIQISSGGGGGGNPVTNYFTPAAAQTIFNLSQAPANPEDTIVRVNSLNYGEGSPTPGYFTVSGTTLTWLNQFLLDPNDEFEVVFFP